MKPKTLVNGLMVAVLVLGVLNACAPTPAAPVATALQESASAPTSVPEPTAEPTAAPTAEPAPELPSEPPDYVALFSELTADITPDQDYLHIDPFMLGREITGNGAVVLDLREAAEIEADGSIAGAVHLPLRDLMKNLDKLPAANTPIVILSASSHLSGFALAALRMMDYTNVHILEGGIAAWVEVNKPVVTGAPEAPAPISTSAIANQQLWTELDAWLSSLPEDLYAIQPEGLNENLLGGNVPVFLEVSSLEQRGYAGSFIDAIRIPLPELMASLDKLPADKAAPVVVYSATGFSGAVAAMAMRLMGYTDVVNLAGGMTAWKADQPPLEFYVGWLPGTALPEPVGGNVVQCAEEPGSIYLIGGFNQQYVSSAKFYHYDIPMASWERLVDMPNAGDLASATCYQGKIYVAGGAASNNASKTLWIYDIASASWSNGPSSPERGMGRGLGAWDGKLYLVGGTPYQIELPVSRVDVFDIASGVWTAEGAASMPAATAYFTSAQAGPYLYVVGGLATGDPGRTFDQVQRFDMSTNTWETGPALTDPRALGGLVATSSHLYLLGGVPDNCGFNCDSPQIFILDLSTWPEGSWTVSDLYLPANYSFLDPTCSVAMTGGEIWIVGGTYEFNTSLDGVFYLPVEEGCP